MRKIWLKMKRDFFAGAAEQSRKQYNFWLKKLREVKIELGEIVDPADVIHNSIRQFFEGMGMDVRDAEIVAVTPHISSDKPDTN
jgi:hypothetical protein